MRPRTWTQIAESSLITPILHLNYVRQLGVDAYEFKKA